MAKVSKVILKTAPKETFGKFHFHFKCYFHRSCDFTGWKIERVPLNISQECQCGEGNCSGWIGRKKEEHLLQSKKNLIFVRFL
ncbi:hypothetical protein CRE_12314 [Caenorhabditis remanei]|uniref:Post-SET domain-containing protein n=1 Tax=Caenorhabditis remanei TaxID=31234 RepID=E3NH17_CAERE|nr:hypothetical protein CRE_12314 [Caenorhabditis remanei]